VILIGLARCIALGAALATEYIYYQNPRKINGGMDAMNGSYLGPEYSEIDIEYVASKYKAEYSKYVDCKKLTNDVAEILSQGDVVGWFQGRMEFGPRALGNRSILGDARNNGMQKKLNLKIKFREGFRPFAPSVMVEDTQTYFNIHTDSPYMLLVASVKEDHCKNVPEGYFAAPMMERLYIQRSNLQAITHVDFSARIQTVHKETNERYWNLIHCFKEKTGCGVIVNTSFNVRGEPIVCTPEDAFKCFMRTDMDFLVMNNYVFDKKKQPQWDEQHNWKSEFKLD
jgi:carbamoyltransferase